jgi:thioredoxin-like negative regulator of GroEL
VIEQLLQADRLLTVDQVEQARQVYARVAQADPGNAIAVVGLARCALADGDDRRAHALAADALRIDPENDMARRMATRLAEVLAARDELVAPPDGDELVASPVRGAPTRLPAATAPRGRPGDLAAPAVPAKPAPARRSLLERLRGR